jgi:putative FmdB family regulatory protein
MPIYEYACRSCHHQFEQLVRTGDKPCCPRCQSADLERRLSSVMMSSEQTRKASLDKARRAANREQRDKNHAQWEYEKRHHDESH